MSWPSPGTQSWLKDQVLGPSSLHQENETEVHLLGRDWAQAVRKAGSSLWTERLQEAPGRGNSPC